MAEERRGGGGRPDDGGGRPPRRFGGGGGGGGGGRSFARRRMDPLTTDGILHVDYKDVPTLRRFISDRGKIEPRRRVSTSAKHQRSLAIAIKRARHLGLLPFTEGVRDGRERGGRGGRDRDDRGGRGDRGPRTGGFDRDDRGPRSGGFDRDRGPSRFERPEQRQDAPAPEPASTPEPAADESTDE
ncbi:MAG: 30S ribosomal protein S18 [Chloroflexia bacterium]|nr:30S ribosomal protein S18 [Chloroflexia bacterium]